MLRNSRRPHFRLHYTFEKFRSSFFTFKTTAFVSVEEDNGRSKGPVLGGAGRVVCVCVSVCGWLGMCLGVFEQTL